MVRSLIPYAATHGVRPFQKFFPDMLWRMEPRQRVVYLTFDDGPTPAGTRRLLDLLADHGARATFFLIGRHAQDHPDLVTAIHQAGHRIGNHTFSHLDPWSAPQDVVRRELSRTTTLLENQIGTPIRFMRPPYGKFTGPMRTWCAERNQRMVMWDVMPGDYLRSARPGRVADFVIETVRPGSIVVLHDNPVCEDVTPQALETILRTLGDAGWRFDAM
jgi:peptidoglycan/xylan/chitin deacetylase (PgdA/CDA1 family)